MTSLYTPRPFNARRRWNYFRALFLWDMENPPLDFMGIFLGLCL